jgi:two-component sensor histidine kinase
MILTSAFGMTALRLNVPPWLLGRRTLLRFAGILVLAVVSLTLSAIATEHTRQARSWVSDSREVQRAIDKFVWALLGLQQATQAHRLDRGPDHTRRFAEIRNGVRADIDALIRQTLDNPVQQQLLAALDARSTHYMSNVDRLAASEAAGRVGLDLAPSLMADADEMSRLIGEMRDHEDASLQSRSELAETSFELLLPTLFVSAGLIALLMAMAAKSISRIVRQRDVWLMEKDGELAAKDMLMREVDHRARNSLDLVYNLMTLQQQRPGNDDNTRNLLAEAANQILVVARVHDRLYRVRVSDRLPVGDFLRELCDDIAAYSLPKEQRALIRIQAAEAELPAEQAIWFGLIVVELVTNALKYGSPSVDGPILVEVNHLDGQLRVAVSDGGRGLPDDFDPRSPKGLGMQVVGLLVKQLHGTLTIDRAWPGARFIITMPLQDHHDRDHDRVASATAASVKTSAAIWPGPSGSCSATAEAVTPMIGTAMVPIAATDAGSRARAANQLR